MMWPRCKRIFAHTTEARADEWFECERPWLHGLFSDIPHDGPLTEKRPAHHRECPLCPGVWLKTGTEFRDHRDGHSQEMWERVQRNWGPL
jgi:galactose-1-phosphate uridylyltransferase